MRGYVEALEAAHKFGYPSLTETEQALLDSTPDWENTEEE